MEIFLIILGVAGAIALLALLVIFIRNRMNAYRMMNMVFLRVMIPRRESKEESEKERDQYSSQKDFKEITGVATQFFEALHGMYHKEVAYFFLGQDFISFEYAVIDGLVNFFIVVPRHLVGLVEKQLTAFYPHSYVEESTDYNIFQEGGYATGCYIKMQKHYMFPVRKFSQMTYDPLNNMVNSLSKIEKDEGAAIQIMIRPKKDTWQKSGRKAAKKMYYAGKDSAMSWLNPLTWIRSFHEMMVGAGDGNQSDMSQQSHRVTPMTDEIVKAIEEKNSKVGFETVIRVVATGKNKQRVKSNLSEIRDAFAQYTAPQTNGLTYTKIHRDKNLVQNFILRRFRRNSLQWILARRRTMMSPEELASLYHLPNINYNKSTYIAWQNFKVAPAPENIPKEGILLGHNIYRGVKKEIRVLNEDRFRHFYVIGQTGTGKSSMFQSMIRQDLKMGRGICVVDPHGSLIEDIMPFIPRERADDVIYFNPGDLERPMGLNLLEAETDDEKEFIALESMNMMIKLFNEEIFGPRIQDYFRNGVLTLMADPEGGALTDIVRLFTDDDFQRFKVEHVKNPIVMSFWKHQMAKTGAREKQEMIPYFAAKFGQFVTNSMMRNIIGQTKSAFDFTKVMQEGKILLMNLSKGNTGEVNSKLLGLITVLKIQMAAMKRQKIPKGDRKDFYLYIDEFQNYITESIETILSEARKYRLSLNMAHQYLGQLEEEKSGMQKGHSKVKDAVFGNVGTMMFYKIGAQDAEFLAKEMAPVFAEQDLINMDKYKGVMKLSIETQPSRPFSIIPLNPYLEEGDKEAAEAFKQLSRLKYGREREFVEREIVRRIGADFSTNIPNDPLKKSIF
ncbi:MAG: type IV secretory system conjugative DNA transfer family protein [Patescibacteria group bacterium]|nr:type IV secretion system DNA-binding domain-containing protein [Patescibacteria group bacterium]